MRVNVSTEGWVHEAKVCSGDRSLSNAAETAASRAKIKPTKFRATTVATSGLLIFTFDPQTSFDEVFELPCFMMMDRHKYLNDLLMESGKFDIPKNERIPHGAVILQITINESGKVEAAKAISGPENMRPYVEKALLTSRFRALEQCGKPAKLTGLFGVDLSTISDN